MPTKIQTLSPSQLTAAVTEHPFKVVMAGPGSGKTKTLTHAIDYLLAMNKAVENEIVVITFTNAAANEIVERVATMNGPEPEDRRNIKFNYIGTVHGWMLRLLKEHGKLIGFRGKIAMLSEDQQERLFKQVIKEMKYKGAMKEVRAALAVGPSSYIKKDDSAFATATFNDAQLVAFEYYQRLLSGGFLDFDSLLQFGVILIGKLNEAGHRWPFRFLFWDEFQDSGKEDAAILRQIQCDNKFVVGDPDQSIYGFRGGDPSHLLKLIEDQSSRVFFLQENFRCDNDIAQTANRLIAHNPNAHVGTISMTGQDGRVWTWRATTEQEELRGLAEDINAQGDPNKCAVLVRSNVLAAHYAKGLEAFGIPISRKEKTEKPADWATARSLINLFASPDNDHLAYWFLETQHDTAFANKIKLEALSKFTSINRNYLRLPNDMNVADVPAALAKSGIGVESLALVHKAIEGLTPGATMSELSFGLGDDELHRKEIGQGVTVTTMHSAKGREWDCVYLPAFEDGIVPIMSKSSNLEEERRIAFVAITRAKHKLSISFCEKRKPQYGGFKPEPTLRSRFQDEIKPPVNNP